MGNLAALSFSVLNQKMRILHIFSILHRDTEEKNEIGKLTISINVKLTIQMAINC